MTTPQRPRAILLTGATGSLGGQLCAELLSHTVHMVYCLARNSASNSAQQRLLRHLSELDDAPDPGSRLVVLAGDVEQRGLGVPPRQYDMLAETVDTIIHCAASVNLAGTYQELESPNVAGARNVLALAEHRAARTGHAPRFNYVSTLATFVDAYTTGLTDVDETTPSSPGTAGSWGYARSKAAAEAELRSTAARIGVPVTIMRPGMVAGHSRTGRCATTDLLRPLLQAAVALRAAPAYGEAPAATIDIVARAIRMLCRHDGDTDQVFHLISGQPLLLPDAFAALRRAGYPLENIDPAEWWRRIDRADSNPGLRPVLAMREVYTRIVPIDETRPLPRFGCAATWSALSSRGLSPTRWEPEYFDRLVAQLAGILPAAEGRRSAPVPTEQGRGHQNGRAVQGRRDDRRAVVFDGVINPQSFHECSDGAAQAAQACAAAGYGMLWVEEHKHDPLLTLAAAAAGSPAIGLGTNIMVALAHNPMTVARAANDLHARSGGRFVLGLGTQIGIHLARRYSMPGDHRRARIREFTEALRAIWEAWNEQRPLHFQGRYYTHTLMTPFFAPDPNPYGPPKIILAAVGPRMAELAGEIADGITAHQILSPRYVAEILVPAAEKGLARSGRSRESFTVVYRPFLVTGRDADEYAAVARTVRKTIAFFASTPAYRTALDFHGYGSLADELAEMSMSSDQNRWDRMGESIGDALLEEIAVRADPAGIASALIRRIGGVADRIVLPAPAAAPSGLWHPDVLSTRNPRVR